MSSAPITPFEWARALSAPPVASSDPTAWGSALLRRWTRTSPFMEQPPLDCHYIAMHLGGPKQIIRRHGSTCVSTIAQAGSLTIVPAGSCFTWRTNGPIGFAHLYLSPQQLNDAVDAQFERNGHCVSPIEQIGCRDPVLESLYVAMVNEIEDGRPASALLLDSLLESFLVQLIRAHLSQAIGSRLRAIALAPYRLHRVLEFVEAHLAENIRLVDLAYAAGSSQFHFSRAFREATGYSPYRYVIQRRIERAKALLMTSDEPLAIVASRYGFNSQRQFAVMFKRVTGVGPKRFRIVNRALKQPADRSDGFSRQTKNNRRSG